MAKRYRINRKRSPQEELGLGFFFLGCFFTLCLTSGFSLLAAPTTLELGSSQVIELGAEWRFQPGDDPRWADPEFVEVGWQSVQLSSQPQLTSVAAGWLRREVDLRQLAHLNPPGQPVSLAVILSGHPGDYGELFLNGVLRDAYLQASYLPSRPKAILLPLDPQAESIHLALRYQPAAARSAGIGVSLLVGEPAVLRSLAQHDQFLHHDLSSIALAVFFAVICGYYAWRFFRGERLLKYAWFAAAAGLTASYILLVSPWAAKLTTHQVAIHRLTGFTLHLGIATLAQLLWPLFGRRIGRWLRAYQLSHLACAVFVLVFPAFYWVLKTQAWRWAWILPFLVMLAAFLVDDLHQRRPAAQAIAIGGFLGLAGGLLELIYQLLGWGTTFPLPAWGLVYFLLALAASLPSRAPQDEPEFAALRSQLERMVEDRTEELSAANERLKAEISERQLAEGAMRMLERAVEQSIDGLLVSDLNGSTQFANESWARMHGYAVFDLLGHHLSLFHTPEQMRQEVQPLLNQVQREGAAQSEVAHRRKDGTTFPTLMSVTLLHEPDKGAVGFVIFARDVTERRRAEEERQRLETKVQQAQKFESLAVLAGGIAHDYNNLLTGVLGNVSLALLELPPNASAREKIEQIEKAAERAADLAGQLLAYAGKSELIPRRLELNELVNDMAPLLRTVVTKNAELKLYLRDGLPPIAADPNQIRQVILNLLTNSSEAITDERGVITVRTSKIKASRSYLDSAFLDTDLAEGEYVLLGISDTGIGMDEETRSKMFDPFFSAKSSGRGLGLAAVLGIVRGHHGTIKVYSQPGRGTTIEVLFPVLAAKARPVVVEEEDWSSFVGSGTVLVIDDEEVIRSVSQDVLTKRGFEVLTAQDGRSALDLYRLRKHEIRLVFLDRTMPNTDVAQVFRSIRELDPEARVILMSGYLEKEVLEGFGTAGLSGFLQKPFRPEDLLFKIREVLAGGALAAGSNPDPSSGV